MAKPPSKQDASESAPPAANQTESIVDGLQRKLAPVLSDLSRVQREQVMTTVTSVVMSEKYSGAMPHPKHLREFEDILPGSAERMLTMVEKTLDHNIDANTIAQQHDNYYRKLGMWLGFGALLIMIGSAVVAGMYGNNVLAGLLLGASVIGTVIGFINGRSEN